MAAIETKGEDWKAMAGEYRKMSDNITTPVIDAMVSRANALRPFSRATGILDNGCGPGPVMSGLIDAYGSVLPEHCTLICADFSEAMLAQVVGAREAAAAESPWKRVQTVLQDAMDLDAVADASCSHVTAGFVYLLTAAPQKCLSESLRVLGTGGVLAVSSWQGSQWLDLMYVLRKVKADVEVPSLPEGWTSTEGVEGELRTAGFRDVESGGVAVEMKFATREALVEMLLTKMPHMLALTKGLSEEEMAGLKRAMLAQAKEYCADEPGKLKGVALVAVGRK
ncbi:hypothetical protein LTR08_000540 [Meristemomyces frigidus]|nr:hypothetical protein LTR08_000540 [Meristemomyces frigidus]